MLHLFCHLVHFINVYNAFLSCFNIEVCNLQYQIRLITQYLGNAEKQYKFCRKRHVRQVTKHNYKRTTKYLTNIWWKKRSFANKVAYTNPYSQAEWNNNVYHDPASTDQFWQLNYHVKLYHPANLEKKGHWNFYEKLPLHLHENL